MEYQFPISACVHVYTRISLSAASERKFVKLEREDILVKNRETIDTFESSKRDRSSQQIDSVNAEGRKYRAEYQFVILGVLPPGEKAVQRGWNSSPLPINNR